MPRMEADTACQVIDSFRIYLCLDSYGYPGYYGGGYGGAGLGLGGGLLGGMLLVSTDTLLNVKRLDLSLTAGLFIS